MSVLFILPHARADHTWNEREIFNTARDQLSTTRPKIMTCSRLLKTGCNNVVPPTLFIVVNNGSTLLSLNNIVDNYEQRGQHNVVASCFQQP